MAVVAAVAVVVAAVVVVVVFRTPRRQACCTGTWSTGCNRCNYCKRGSRSITRNLVCRTRTPETAPWSSSGTSCFHR